MPRFNMVTSDLDRQKLDKMLEDTTYFTCTRSGLIITLLHMVFEHYKNAKRDGNLNSIQFLESLNEKAVVYDQNRRRRTKINE